MVLLRQENAPIVPSIKIYNIYILKKCAFNNLETINLLKLQDHVYIYVARIQSLN